MFLDKLGLKHFRNYKEININFSNLTNIFVGNNAEGKTNLLEAIYLLSVGRSYRDYSDRNLIQWGSRETKISAQIKKRSGNLSLKIIIDRNGKKVFVNNLIQNKLSNYIGNLNVVLFSPEDLELIKGPPAIRRKFINTQFGQMSRNYLIDLLRYRKILKNRNLFLKKINFSRKLSYLNKTYLEILDGQLCRSGSRLIFQRFKLIKQLRKYSQRAHKIISKKENLDIKYRTFKNIGQNSSLQEIYSVFLKKLKEKQQKELILKTTTIGPHHDDLNFFINGKGVGSFASQGQQRTTALSLKLAEINMIKLKSGEYPILLLDDVFSELDKNRQLHLLNFIKNKVQAFLTTPHLSSLEEKIIKNPKIYGIENGKLSYEK